MNLLSDNRDALWRWGRLIISVSLFAFLLSQIDLGESLKAIAGARPELLALLLLAFVMDRLIATYRWYVLLHGQNPLVTFHDVLRLVLVSGFIGYFIPGGIGADILRVYGLARITSDPLLSVSSVLVERIFALIALMILMVIGLGLQPTGLPKEVAHAAWAALACLTCLVMALMSPQLRRATLALLVTARLTWVHRRADKLYGALDAYARQSRLMAWSLVLALAFQLARCIAPAIGAAALGASLPLVVFLTFMPMIVLITLVPISIAGLGVQDLSFVYLFGLVGMPAEVAFPLSLLIHIGTLLSTLPGAWLYAHSGLHRSRI